MQWRAPVCTWDVSLGISPTVGLTRLGWETCQQTVQHLAAPARPAVFSSSNLRFRNRRLSDTQTISLCQTFSSSENESQNLLLFLKDAELQRNLHLTWKAAGQQQPEDGEGKPQLYISLQPKSCLHSQRDAHNTSSLALPQLGCTLR